MPISGDVSALFSFRHSRQEYLQLCFLHAFTFLPPFGSTVITRFIATTGL